MQSDQIEMPSQAAPGQEPAILPVEPPAPPPGVVEPAGESLAELRVRLARMEAENEAVRSSLNRKISALTLKLDAANQELEAARSGSQAELQRLKEELVQLQAENTRVREDQSLYKEVGDGQQEAVRKLMDRVDAAQARADAAGRRVGLYTILMLFILLIAVASVGICVLIVLKQLGY
jgi:type VI protein secretion system component VasF